MAATTHRERAKPVMDRLQIGLASETIGAGRYHLRAELFASLMDMNFTADQDQSEQFGLVLGCLQPIAASRFHARQGRFWPSGVWEATAKLQLHYR
jgi:hypothetical protein